MKEHAEERLWRVLRFLIGRLFSQDEGEKRRAVQAIGVIVQDTTLVDDAQALELVRRFLWAMSDESGAVPFGIPEGLGEVLTHREELREAYVPILGSFLTSEEMSQTGPIERSVMWGLGRVGPPVRDLYEDAVHALDEAAASHPDATTRAEARRAVERIRGV